MQRVLTYTYFRYSKVTYEQLSFDFSSEPPMYRDFHTATAIGDKMFIFGGRSDKSANEPFGIHGYHPHHFPGLQAEFYSDKLVYLVSFSNCGNFLQHNAIFNKNSIKLSFSLISKLQVH